MVEPNIADDLLSLLKRVDTPTVCNAIEVVEGKRGFDWYTRGTMHHSAPGEIMIGFARTAKIAGQKASEESLEKTRARRMDYFHNMADGPRPAIAVVEDTNFPECVAGWWGEVHSNVHKGLKLNGALTNGVMRDLDVLADGFPILAGSIGVSHAHVHVTEIGSPVTIHGLNISQGDLVHADRHGAVVIPPAMLADLKDAIEKVFSYEAIVIEPAKRADFNMEKLEAAWARFDAVRT